MNVQDPELFAMGQAFDAVKNLNKAQVSRILQWIKDRFGIVEAKAYIEATPDVIYVEAAKSEDNILPGSIEVSEQEEQKVRKSSKAKDLVDFETVLDLFTEAKVKKISSKIILMAAYLQEKQKFSEISSYDINFRLKRIGHGVQNISSSINAILKRKPAIMTLLDSRDDKGEKLTRKRYQVTPEGLKIARSFL